MASDHLPLIDVDRIRPGIYVVLDLGWQSHPFAFSSFTVRTDEQLRQLRALGLRQVRYCPDRSQVEPLPQDAAARPPLVPEPPRPTLGSAEIEIQIEQPAPPIDAVAALEQDSPLYRQEASLKRVEAEFRQATQQHQHLLKHLLFEPVRARQLAQRLGDQLYRMVNEGPQRCLRLLTQRVGERPSAHEVSVSALALLLARDCGFGEQSLRELALAGLLHDIGKVKIPAFLHEDHGQLTEFERGSYRRHVDLGVELAEGLGLDRSVVRAIAEHHERVDGSGFPAGLRGEKLSQIGRVLAIVNRYQNLICPLHHESGMTPHHALQRMYGAERGQYDPEFLPRFVRILGIYPPGSLVELTDQRTAIVIASRPGMSLAPRVQVVEHPDHDEPSLAIDLAPTRGLGIRTSLRPEQLNARWAQRARQLARAPFFLEPVSAADSMARTG